MGIIGDRCQVCDGPVVNGRCKLCGMPYRNDEILYHLNENKEEHYQHANEKARKIMRENQVPLGDKTTVPSGKEKSVKLQQKERPKTDGNKKVYVRTGDVPKSSSRTYSTVEKQAHKNKKSRLVWIILVLVMLLGSVGTDIIEFVENTLFHVAEDTTEKKISTEIELNKILR